MKKGIFITIILIGIASIGLAIYVILNNSKVNIVFNTNSEQQLSGLKINKNGSIDLPVLEKDNYKFLGWYVDNVKVDNNYKFSKDAVLNAKWEKIEETIVEEEKKIYTVTFDSNGGSSVKNQSVKDGEKTKSPSNPTRDGYTFVEWQLNNSKYNFDNPVTSDITLIAKWKSVSTTVTMHTVRFEIPCCEGCKCQDKVMEKEVEDGKKVEKPVNPAMTGYTFVEWQLNGNKYDFNTPITGDITLVAKWQKNSSTKKVHTVRFSIPCCLASEDCKCASRAIDKEVVDGEKVERPQDPSISGLKFVEWQLNGKKYDFNKPVTSDLTIIAKWESASGNYYNITLIDEHRSSTASSSVLNQQCKKPITNLPELPSNGSSTQSNIFLGWFDANNKQYKNGDTMPCNNITLYASWGTTMYPEGVKKPLIYLYPEKEINVEIKVGYPELFTTVYPKYNDGWDVKAYPNGKLIDNNTGRELYGLYWEGKEFPSKVTNEGFVVKGSDTIEFLEEKLAILGLNEREAEEFIIYWLPQMEHNEYNYIRFATKGEIDKYMPLEISPKPDTVIRIAMEFMPLDTKINVKEQKLIKVERRGFTVVEWGGSLITSK